MESGHSAEEVYGAVVAVAGYARSIYDRNVLDSIGDDVFLPMMFYDACFLVQYMLTCTDAGIAHMDPALRSFFDANNKDVYHDIMQLENQLPWLVVRAVMAFRPVPLKEFVASLRGCLQDRKDRHEKPFVMDDAFEPPHLLGLLRYYIVGRSDVKLPTLPETESMSFSVSAIELAEIGITLTASKTSELVYMGVNKKGNLFAELSLSPLSLDDTRASVLLNMAALELEEDVHELRARRVLQRGGGLTNREALRFLTSVQGLRLGSRYVRIMEEIEDYKVNRRTRTKLHAFVYRNVKVIVAVISVIAALASIIGTIRSLKSQ
ncbi:unnamed protein product [Miscanthus lutarioriparius]|uniref:Uncharacterized protein n=1 Tax=Miscanthus lutarioriparius TaxID=422564 RepID=A0A811QBC3_9POAL|nr:unnamed protein product [Miscanthus lutarioriparius]